MFQSPLKTVAEKLKPTDSKSTVSSLRFERSSDFKKFITFIKDETKELEKIKLPSATEIKPKRGASGLLGLGALGLVGLLGGAFGGGENEENLRLGSAGQTSPIKSNLFISKNVRKVQKNLGVTKGIKNKKSFMKRFNKLFKKPGKSELEELQLKKGARKTRIEEEIKKLVKRKKELEKDKRIGKKLQFGDDVDARILQEEIDSINQEIKNLTKKIKLDDDIFKIISKDTKGNFKSKINVIREIIDESDISFDRKGNFKFGKGSNFASRLTIQNIIDSSSQGKDVIKKIASMDPLLFDVPEGGTAFSKILGETRGIKIENRMGIIRESLDDIFTNVGKTTKPLRNFFSPIVKNIAKTKVKIPFIPGKLSLLRGIKGIKTGLPFIDAINAGFMFNQLGFVDFSDSLLKPKIGRNNVITGLYDVFTRFYNAGVEGLGFSDANKRLLIGKPKDEFVTGTTIGGSYRRNLRREKDAYNKKILDAKRMRDLFNRSLGDQMTGQEMELLKSVPFASSTSDGAEFNIPIDPLNSFDIFTYSKLDKQ